MHKNTNTGVRGGDDSEKTTKGRRETLKKVWKMLLKILNYRGFFNGAGCVLSLPLSFRAAASAFCCGVGCVRGGVSLSLSVCGVVSSLPTHLSPPPRPPGAERHPPHITLEERDNPQQVFGGSTGKCEGNIMQKM